MRWLYEHNLAWLLLAVAACAVAAWGWYRRYRLGLQLERPSSNGKHALKWCLRSAALVLLGLAALGPSWGHEEAAPLPARGRDVLVVLDVSRSMLAQDAKPSRLEAARAGLTKLATELQDQGGFRLGLIAFADRAALLCPLTADVQHFLDELKDVSIDSLRLKRETTSGVDGTQLGIALQRAERALPEPQPGEERHVDVLLISDGGDALEQDGLDAATALGHKARVVALGMGDPDQASPIPVPGSQGRTQTLTHDGQVVEVRLEEAPLRQVATLAGGTYLRAPKDGMPLSQLLRTLSEGSQRDLQVTAGVRMPILRFEWFLLPAILLLVLDVMIGTGRSRSTGTKSAQIRGWLARAVPNEPMAGARRRELQEVRK